MKTSLNHHDTVPLAERMRPRTLSQFVGQTHIMGPGRLISGLIKTGTIPSMIYWGPPGSGKTTLARLLAAQSEAYFESFSAVLSGVKDLREVIDRAKYRRAATGQATILFIDEIHRFNKAQQDALLPHVEAGVVTLLGATTENPSFEVISALLSRTRVVVLHPLSSEEILVIIHRTLEDEENGLGGQGLTATDEALDFLAQTADGDARVALNALASAADLALAGNKVIDQELIAEAVQKKALLYDKGGEEHYNLISAFHKSLRGSDPDAALYWMARMIESGEDPFYIARRMVRFASEDIGVADVQALQVALAAMEAVRFVGLPEGNLALAEAAVYLAAAPKSNSLYKAYGKVVEEIKKSGALPVPLHIRNAPTKLMDRLGYGRTYKYPHDFPHALVDQEYLPERLDGRVFYYPSNRGFEKIIKERLDYIRTKVKSRNEPES
ncbi:MAG: replication-associated recombination protein A [Deltaproteobacteria bacterium]|nr:replication-associated recombination protein A [Deltaproteobacteria bacterium]